MLRPGICGVNTLSSGRSLVSEYRGAKCPEKAELFVGLLRRRFRDLGKRALSGDLLGGQDTQPTLI